MGELFNLLMHYWKLVLFHPKWNISFGMLLVTVSFYLFFRIVNIKNTAHFAYRPLTAEEEKRVKKLNLLLTVVVFFSVALFLFVFGTPVVYALVNKSSNQLPQLIRG